MIPKKKTIQEECAEQGEMQVGWQQTRLLMCPEFDNGTPDIPVFIFYNFTIPF